MQLSRSRKLVYTGIVDSLVMHHSRCRKPISTIWLTNWKYKTRVSPLNPPLKVSMFNTFILQRFLSSNKSLKDTKRLPIFYFWVTIFLKNECDDVLDLWRVNLMTEYLLQDGYSDAIIFGGPIWWFTLIQNHITHGTEINHKHYSIAILPYKPDMT